MFISGSSITQKINYDVETFSSFKIMISTKTFQSHFSCFNRFTLTHITVAAWLTGSILSAGHRNWWLWWIQRLRRRTETKTPIGCKQTSQMKKWLEGTDAVCENLTLPGSVSDVLFCCFQVREFSRKHEEKVCKEAREDDDGRGWCQSERHRDQESLSEASGLKRRGFRAAHGCYTSWF